MQILHFIISTRDFSIQQKKYNSNQIRTISKLVWVINASEHWYSIFRNEDSAGLKNRKITSSFLIRAGMSSGNAFSCIPISFTSKRFKRNPLIRYLCPACTCDRHGFLSFKGVSWIFLKYYFCWFESWNVCIFKLCWYVTSWKSHIWFYAKF